MPCALEWHLPHNSLRLSVLSRRFDPPIPLCLIWWICNPLRESPVDPQSSHLPLALDQTKLRVAKGIIHPPLAKIGILSPVPV